MIAIYGGAMIVLSILILAALYRYVFIKDGLKGEKAFIKKVTTNLKSITKPDDKDEKK